MITKSKVTEIFVLPMISAKNLMQRWQKTLFNQRLIPPPSQAYDVGRRGHHSSSSISTSTSTPTATSSIITRPVCALFGRL